MSTQTSNKLKALLLTKTIDLVNDTIKCALMSSSFVFSKTTHHTYGELTNELATAYGYTAGGADLTGGALVEDDTNNLGKVTYNAVSWIATGGSIVAAGAILYDDTVASPVTKPVLGYIDFNGTKTATSGATFSIADIYISMT